MALTWTEVAASAEFLALPPQTREQARVQYFSEVVAPQVGRTDLPSVYTAFLDDTKADVWGAELQPAPGGSGLANALAMVQPENMKALMLTGEKTPVLDDAGVMHASTSTGSPLAPASDRGGYGATVGQAAGGVPLQGVAAMIRAAQGVAGATTRASVDALPPADRVDDFGPFMRGEVNPHEVLYRAGREAQQSIEDAGARHGQGSFGQEIAKFGPNLGYSLGVGLPGLGAGALATVAGGPLAGKAAALATIGTMAYRSSANHFTQQILQAAAEEKGATLSGPEETALKERFDSTIVKYGLAEAVPEAATDVLVFPKLFRPLASAFGKNIATKALGRLAGAWFPEQAGETVTQMLQGQAEVDVGLSGGKRPDLANPGDWWQASKEVAPQTAMMTGVLAGAGGAYRQGKKILGKGGPQQFLEEFAQRYASGQLSTEQVEALKQAQPEMAPEIERVVAAVQSRYPALPPGQDFQLVGKPQGPQPAEVISPPAPAQPAQLPPGQGFELQGDPSGPNPPTRSSSSPVPSPQAQDPPRALPAPDWGAIFSAAEPVGQIQSEAAQGGEVALQGEALPDGAEALRPAPPLMDESGGTSGASRSSVLETGIAPVDGQGADGKLEKVVSLVRVAQRVTERLGHNKKLMAGRLFWYADDAFDGSQAQGSYSVKDAYDALELGVNQFIAKRQVGSDARKAKEDLVFLNDLVELLPTQSKRSDETDEFQQFSTPPPLAYAAAWLANIQSGETVLEPSAGVGGIAVFAKNAGGKVVVNELHPRRAALLERMGFERVFTEKGEQLNNVLPDDVRPTVVVMNPPFSATAGRMRGKRSNKEGFAHVDQALRRLEPGGRLVAVLGAGGLPGRPAAAHFWDRVESQYQIRAAVEVSGKGFRKYGTTFDNGVVVIDKSGADGREPVTGRVESPVELLRLLEDVRNDRGRATQPAPTEPAGQEEAEGGQGVSRPERPVQRATDELGPGERQGGPGRESGPVPTGSNSVGYGRVEARERDDRADQGGRRRVRGSESGAQVEAQPQPQRLGVLPDRRGAHADDGHDYELSDSGRAALEEHPQGKLEMETPQARKAQAEDFGNKVFEPYQPAKLKIPGAKSHPGHLVESAAMAAVEPVAPTYRPNLPQRIVTRGNLSEPQIEAVVYAGQAHEKLLPDGRRRGFLIGDGTGVGKGREIAAIIYDNWRQGRKKAVWVSKEYGLFADACRDMKNIGWSKDPLFKLGKYSLGEAIDRADGVMFTTYGTVPRETENGSRLDQMVDWLGKDFDGVIAFDEAHKMGNAVTIKGKRGTKEPSATGVAGVELQKRLPKARILYVSATSATEVQNMAYAERLGLWSEGTPFADVPTFIEQIAAGGVAAMEMVARDMKSMGSYMARSLSYDDVNYERLEHQLSPEQVKIYDSLAGMWQVVLQNIGEALEETGGQDSPQARNTAMSAFWGAHQRFFMLVITSLQTPAAIKAIKADIEAGRAVVVQLVSTGEAAQERAMAKLREGDAVEDLDITPRSQLGMYLEKSFPTSQYEEFTDSEGKKGSRKVVDSKGDPVENREAVAKREALLNQLGALRIPDAPLDMLLHALGHENVAEVTGRSRRVNKNNPDHPLEKRSKAKGDAEGGEFMDDKRRVLIFSDAGNTGRSYHADLAAKNQRQRVHYLLQTGWRADSAMQGFGRTHRSNQKSAPKYVLVTTNIKGQKRFISSIARRLNQLGALTKGHRETASQGFFQARDNLESSYAREALRNLFKDIAYGHAQGIDRDDFQEQTGLRLVDKNGSMVENLPEMPQFLNRLLSLKLDFMDRVFDAFSEHLDARVEFHTKAGTLDVGLETLRGDKVEVAGEQVVYTDADTGAETKYVELDVTNPARLMMWSVANRQERNGFFRNRRSGKVWVGRGSDSGTDPESGAVETYVRLGSVDYGSKRVFEGDLAEKYERLSKAEAKSFWQAEYRAAPKTATVRNHFITGSLLPIWDRLPHGHARVMQTLTSDGRRLLGRLIDDSALEGVLRNLGVGAKPVEVSDQEAVDKVLEHGAALHLSNGWKIKRARVSGEQRIELLGPEDKHRSELERAHLFSERINYKLRWFIPTDDMAVRALFRITRHRPIMRVQEKGGGGVTVDFMGLQSLFEMIAQRAQKDRGGKPADQWLKEAGVSGELLGKVKKTEAAKAAEAAVGKVEPDADAAMGAALEAEAHEVRVLVGKKVSAFERMVSTPEWFDNKKAREMVLVAGPRREARKAQLFRQVDSDPEQGTEAHKTVGELMFKGRPRAARLALKAGNVPLYEVAATRASKEYKRLAHHLWRMDHEGIQWEAYRELEMENESPAVIEAIEQVRGALDRELELKMDGLRELIGDVGRRLYPGKVKAGPISESTIQILLDGVSRKDLELAMSLNNVKFNPLDGKTLDLLLEAYEQMKSLSGSYFPRKREIGDFLVLAKDGEGRKHLFTAGSLRAAKRKAGKLRKQGWKGWDGKGVVVSESAKPPDIVYQQASMGQSAKLLDAAIERMKKEDGFQAAEWRLALIEEVADVIKLRGALSSKVHRTEEVILGHIEDPLTAYLMHVHGAVAGMAKAEASITLHKIMMGSPVKDKKGHQMYDPQGNPKFEGGIAQADKGLHEFMVRWTEDVLRNTDRLDRLMGLAKSAVSLKYLSAPRSAVVNLTALLQTAPAAIHQYAGGQKVSMNKVLRLLGRASKDALPLVRKDADPAKVLRNKDEAKFIAQVKAEGWDSPQYVREAMGAVAGAYGRAWQNVMSGALWLFGKTEQYNRMVTMLAGYRAARLADLDHAQAVEAAKEASDKSHGIYGEETAPAMARGAGLGSKVGAMWYTYRKFSHNYLQLLWDLGVRRKNAKAVALSLVVPGVISGAKAALYAQGMFAMAELVMTAFLDDDRDPERMFYDWVRRHLSSYAEQVVRYGLAGALGFDVSGSLAVGVEMPRDMYDLFGPFGGVAKDMGHVREAYRDRDARKAFEAAMPTAVANVSKAIREREEGATTRKGRTVFDENLEPFKPTGYETGLRVAGMRSARQASAQDQQYLMRKEQGAFAAKKTDLLDRFEGAVRRGDAQARARVEKDIRQFNQRVLKLGMAARVRPISGASLRRRRKAMVRPPRYLRASEMGAGR